MKTFITKRICAGEYEVTMKDDRDKRVVSISCIEFMDGPGWIASAKWVRDVYSDPYELKRDAVSCATKMLENWDINGKWIGRE